MESRRTVTAWMLLGLRTLGAIAAAATLANVVMLGLYFLAKYW